MRQTFRTVKSIQLLGNGESLVQLMFQRVFDQHGTSVSFIMTEPNLILIASPVERKKSASISAALETPSLNKVLRFLRGELREPVANQLDIDRNCEL